MTLPAHISDLARLPWPFPDPEDAIAVPQFTPVSGEDGAVGDLGSDYVDVMESRAAAFVADPGLLRLSPHAAPACWDVMLYLMRGLAKSHPATMELHRDGTEHRWVNRLLGVDQDFLLGNSGTLPEHPLAFIGTQVPADIRLLAERGGALCVEAAFVTSSAGSVAVDAGVAEGFLRPLLSGQEYRRVNWTFSADDPDIATSDRMADGDWGSLELRIDVEHLARLPMTGTPALISRAYSASLADIVAMSEWAGRLADAVEALPEPIAASKCVEGCRVPVTAWLRSQVADAEEAVVQGESAA